MFDFFWTRRFEPHDLDALVFGQQHWGTQAFFIERFGQCHTVPLRRMPHFQLLARAHENPYDSLYEKYLQASWGYLKPPDQNTEALRHARVDAFLTLFDDVRERGKIVEPIHVCQRPDGRYLLIDGNHRAAIALRLNFPVAAKVVCPAKHLRAVCLVKGEFYGSGRLGMPYQSIFYGEDELVRGRRPDIVERIKKIIPDDLNGRTVMDLGCNLGANCYSAVGAGARSAVGVDHSPKLISGAVRMNAYFAMPCRFIVHDLNTELAGAEPADTVFCFSVTSHLKDLSGLVATLRKVTKHTLYFEGHPNSGRDDYPQILDRELFSRIEQIGLNRESVDRPRKTRPFFRCEV